MKNQNITVKEYLLVSYIKENFDEWVKLWLTSVVISNKKFRIHQVNAGIAISNNREGQIIISTGAGKTLIEIGAIILSIIVFVIKSEVENHQLEGLNEGDVPVFSILSPKIQLSRQLFQAVADSVGFEAAHFLIVDSGNLKQLKESRRAGFGIVIKSTTSSKTIKEEYEKAKKHNLPLILISTYDSAKRIVEANIPLYMLICDEAHHVTENGNNWIPIEFPAFRKYYFTATRNVSASDQGSGMNNPKFGDIIYEIGPAELIDAGEIVPPRLHIVYEEDKSSDATILDESASSIKSAFDEHQRQLDEQTSKLNFNELGIPMIKMGAKMLVGAKNSNDVEDHLTHKEIKDCIENRGDVDVFDITCKFGPRKNGISISKEEFLEELRNLKDEDKAIIFHIRILREGIDVPGITGVYFTSWGSIINFVQSLGRATRLHDLDRERLYSGKIKPREYDKFVKPFAWIIIPVFNEEGEDLKSLVKNALVQLKMYGFRVDNDIVVSTPTRRGDEDEDDKIPDKDKDNKSRSSKNYWVNYFHEIEEIIVEKEVKTYTKNIFKRGIHTLEEIFEYFRNE